MSGEHDLIEKVLKAMWTTIPLLKSGKTRESYEKLASEFEKQFPLQDGQF